MGDSSGEQEEELPRTLHCLTVKQPWAFALVAGHKDVENRSWPTHYRGWLAIHAAATDASASDAAECAALLGAQPLPAQLARSAVVGVVRLAAVRSDSSSAWARAGELHFCVSDARALPAPVPCSGHPRLWVLNEQLTAAVAAQLQADA
jgi:hypothetical protein